MIGEPFGRRASVPASVAVGLAIVVVAGVLVPFTAVALLPAGSVGMAAALALGALAWTFGIPVLIALVVGAVLREARAARASAARIAAELGWTHATRGGRPAFVGRHRDRPAYVMSSVRIDPSTAGRKHLNARPVVRVGFDAPPRPGGPEGVDLAPRGATAADVVRALNALFGEEGSQGRDLVG